METSVFMGFHIMLSFFGGFMLYPGREAGERQHVNYEYYICLLKNKKGHCFVELGARNMAHLRLDLGGQGCHFASRLGTGFTHMAG